MDATSITCIYTLISILILGYLLFWCYRSYSLARFRQDIFDLRDELFDRAYKGLVSFEHPAYSMLRSTMNGFLRFGHMLSFWQIFIFMILVRKEKMNLPHSYEQEWEKATRDLDDELKTQLNQYRGALHFSILKHLIFSSPLLMLTIFAPLIAYFGGKEFCQAIVQRIKRFIKPPTNEIDSIAYALGR